MTLPEVFERFDDEHLDHLYAASLLDGDGYDDQRTARICATLVNTVMNALRLSGKEVADTMYRSEDDFLPKQQQRSSRGKSRLPQQQTWEQMRSAIHL